jgi:uncharacterized protein YndB with AHSA1/START domain
MTTTTTDRGLTIVRRFDAPRELVFRAWTDPDHLHWYAGPGPAGPPATVDLRVGGAWRFHMAESAQKQYITGGIYLEIEPPRRLVFAWGAVDGWPSIDPARPLDNPIVTITLADVDGGTEMVFQFDFPDHFTDAEVRRWFDLGVADGWTQTLARLAP